VDAGYYGYNLDEEDGTLLAYEAKQEKEAWDHFMTLGDDLSEKSSKVQREWIELPGDAGDGVRWRVPTLEEVEEELVERRRRKMLEKLG
jgi:pre-mRNA-splicing factor ISY1